MTYGPSPYGGAPPPGWATAAYAPAPRATGAAAYAVGLLVCLPVPVVNIFIAGGAMARVYRSMRRLSPLAAENSRHAANWGLTLLTVFFVVVTPVVVMLWALEPTEVWMFLPLVLLVPAGIVHLVIVVKGFRRAKRGLVYASALAIPFLRPRRPLWIDRPRREPGRAGAR